MSAPTVGDPILPIRWKRCQAVNVPRFEPFRALRFSPELVHLVTAPPYDVLSAVERDDLAQQHVHNIVHVDVPLESDGPDRYRRAAQLFESWKQEGVLRLDPSPSFTIYRMTFLDSLGRRRSTVGVVGALEVVDEGAGGVLPHERTTPKAKTDRLDLTRATHSNLSPVWGLSLGGGLSSELRDPGESMGRVVVGDVEHSFERVDDVSRIERIRTLISSHDVVIADGHHRYAISRAYRDELRAAKSPLSKAAELTMTYTAELVEEQLSVAAIHRLYTTPDVPRFLDALRDCFTFEETSAIDEDITSTMESKGCLTLLTRDGRFFLLTPRPEVLRGVRDLDGSRLEHALDGVAHDVSYQHGVSHVAAMMKTAHYDAAILIRPVTVAEIRRTADQGLLMPPKSTFFTPKILTGSVIRPLG